MKYNTFFTLVAIMLTMVTSAKAQLSNVTLPAGYVTHKLKANQYNLIGLTLHNSAVAEGNFDLVAGVTLTDNDVDFTTLLTSGKRYILEILENTASPSIEGTVQEVSSWTAHTLTTPDDIVTEGLASGAKYRIRPATTLQSIFGENNQAGLKEGYSGTADLVWLTPLPVPSRKKWSKMVPRNVRDFPEPVPEVTMKLFPAAPCVIACIWWEYSS